jgi:hypothetical protein
MSICLVNRVRRYRIAFSRNGKHQFQWMWCNQLRYWNDAGTASNQKNNVLCSIDLRVTSGVVPIRPDGIRQSPHRNALCTANFVGNFITTRMRRNHDLTDSCVGTFAWTCSIWRQSLWASDDRMEQNRDRNRDAGQHHPECILCLGAVHPRCYQFHAHIGCLSMGIIGLQSS